MKWSLYLGRVAGIKLYIHWTFLILIAWIFIAYFRMEQDITAGFIGVGFVLVIFVCVILHELGHALTARKYGIKTRNITLLPIGGLANMENMPEKPVQELWVAIMGPVVNVVIFLILYAALKLSGIFPNEDEWRAILEGEASLSSPDFFLFNLMLVNLILALFNLIPAFPMDGGRVLRALLSFSMDRVRATNIAARIGQFLAILFVFAGFYTNFWLIFIGVFIFLGAGGEARFETYKSILSKHDLRDVLMTSYTVLSIEDPIGKAIKILLDSQQTDFVVKDGDQMAGIVTRDKLIRGLHDHDKETPVGKIADREFLSLDVEQQLQKAYLKLMSSKHSVALVYDGDQFIGIIDRENINELIAIDQVARLHGSKMF